MSYAYNKRKKNIKKGIAAAGKTGEKKPLKEIDTLKPLCIK